jgi:tetratricopeptide (TPR) repeat protein
MMAPMRVLSARAIARAIAATIVALPMLSACSSIPETPARPGSEEPGWPEFARTWAETNKFIQLRRFEEVWPRLNELMRSPTFGKIPVPERHDLVSAAVRLGRSQGDFRHTYPFCVAATQMPDANFPDWHRRYDVALRLYDSQEAINALTTLAQRWPESASRYEKLYIQHLALGEGKWRTDDASRLKLLQALYAAKYTINFGTEPSVLWQELTRLLADAGRMDAAAEVAGRITYPHSLLALRVDNRFAAIVAAHPERFDIEPAIDRELALWRDIVAHTPTKLDPLTLLAGYAVDSGRYDEALSVTDGALANLKAHHWSPKTYDDFNRQMHWLRAARANALIGLGRWEEGERELDQAASLPEDGGQNVSDAINLAIYEVRRGRPEDAMKALGRLARAEETSEYGTMTVYSVLHAVAIERNDDRAAHAALDYMREHQSDALDLYQNALLFADEQDEAAALIVRRLADPALRIDALLQLQEYREPPHPPIEQRLRDEWRALRERADVRAAVAKVGRIEQVPMPQL